MRHPAASLLALAVAVRLLVVVWDLVSTPQRELAGQVPDDVFYYLVVARNLAAGLGPTFDGVELTNGYHPLWLLLLTAGSAVLPDGAMLTAALLVAGALAVGAYFVLAWVTSSVVRISPAGLAVGAVVVTGPLAWERTVNGMEDAAVIAAVAAVAWAARRWWARPSLAAMSVVGVTCGVLCLARTSQVATVAVIPVLLLWGLARSGRSVSVVRQLAVCGAGAAAVFVPWFVWSWAAVGSPVSSAAMVKSNWQQRSTGAFPSVAGLEASVRAGAEELWRQVTAVVPAVDPAPSLVRQLLQVVVVAGLVWLAGRLLWRRPAAVVVVAPILALLGRLLIELLLVPTRLSIWYWAPVFAVTALVCAVGTTTVEDRLAASDLRPGRPAVRRALSVVGAAAFIVVSSSASATVSTEWERANLEAAEQLQELPASARIGAFDAGLLGHRRPGVVNLDGLVRNPVYVRRLLDAGRPADVVLDERLDYLVGRLAPGDARLPACAHPVWHSERSVVIDGHGEPVRIWALDRC